LHDRIFILGGSDHGFGLGFSEILTQEVTRRGL